jgi:hypothetical protein
MAAYGDAMQLDIKPTVISTLSRSYIIIILEYNLFSNIEYICIYRKPLKLKREIS